MQQPVFDCLAITNRFTKVFESATPQRQKRICSVGHREVREEQTRLISNEIDQTGLSRFCVCRSGVGVCCLSIWPLGSLIVLLVLNECHYKALVYLIVYLCACVLTYDLFPLIQSFTEKLI